MKINIMSDLHNEFSPLPHPKNDADVVVLAGDIDVFDKGIDWAIEFEKPVIYVAGNHEYYNQNFHETNATLEKLSLSTNVNFLQNQVTVIQDNEGNHYRFLGCTLWTDFMIFGEDKFKVAIRVCGTRMNDYYLIKYSKDNLFTPLDSKHENRVSTSFLESELSKPFKGKTIVVTHHCPSSLSSSRKYTDNILTAAYASNLEHMMGEKIDLWIHGHVHNNNDYKIRNTRIISNPRGYMNGYPSALNPEFDENLIIEL